MPLLHGLAQKRMMVVARGCLILCLSNLVYFILFCLKPIFKTLLKQTLLYCPKFSLSKSNTSEFPLNAAAENSNVYNEICSRERKTINFFLVCFLSSALSLLKSVSSLPSSLHVFNNLILFHFLILTLTQIFFLPPTSHPFRIHAASSTKTTYVSYSNHAI